MVTYNAQPDIMMIEHPVVCAPYVWLLSPPPTKSPFEPPQEVVVELRADGLTRLDKFFVENPVNGEKTDQHCFGLATLSSGGVKMEISTGTIAVV